MNLHSVLEGYTAAQMVVAADDFGWWTKLEGANGAGVVVAEDGALPQTVARALVRAGWLEPDPDEVAQAEAGAGSGTGARFRLSDEGREVAHNRGFVRVVARGWMPTFHALDEAPVHAPMLPAQTQPEDVARGCTDIARRCPETFRVIAERLRADPGTTIDLGCDDSGRLLELAKLAPDERLAGVDLSASVIRQATRRNEKLGLAQRVQLFHGDVTPRMPPPQWLGARLREQVTTAMSFFLLHQLASDGGGIGAVLEGWSAWFPNLRRLVIGDGLLSPGSRWDEQPWFAPTYELYHELTGVRLWAEEEYREAFASLGWTIAERCDVDHPMLVMYVLER